MSRPARKVGTEISPEDRLLGYHEQKARELGQQIKQLEDELTATGDPAKAVAARRRISRLTGIASKSLEHAERLRRTPSESPG